MHKRTPLVGLGIWLLAATGFVAGGGLTLLGPPFPQVILVAFTAALFAAYAARRSFRAWVDAVPNAWILGLHTVRFVGAYFLFLHAHGRLPWDFAVLGGWGDIVIAVLAVALLLAYRGSPPPRALGFQLWNLAGLIDIGWVVAFAAKNALQDAGSMAPLLELPLGLLPTIVVPLIVFTHGVVLVRALGQPIRAPRD